MKYKTEMKRRGVKYSEITDIFFFLCHISYIKTPLAALWAAENEIIFYCQELVCSYTKDFNPNFPGEIKQFHTYVRPKISSMNKPEKKSHMQNV